MSSISLKKYLVLSTVTLAFMPVFSVPYAVAQEANDGVGFDQIVVTAQRREQNLMEVPISLTVITGKMMDENHVTGFEDIAAMTPNLTFLETDDMKFSVPRIRGVFGNVLSGGGIDQPTAVYVDDIYMNSSVAQQFDLYDVERTEILRGPQGTLFGRNTVAGVISVTTKEPTDEAEGYLEASYGNYNALRLRASYSGPIVEDKLYGKIAGVYFDRNGYETNVFTGNDANAKHNWGVRGKLRYDASDDLTFSLIADYRKVDQDARAMDTAGYNQDASTTTFGVDGPGLIYTGSTLNPLFASFVPGYTFNGIAALDTDPFDRNVSVDFEGREELDAWGLALVTDVDFNNMSLKSITSYRTHDFFQSFDLDSTEADNTRQGAPESVDAFTQELRLTSAQDDTFEWIAGLFYYNQKSISEFNIELRDPATSPDMAELVLAIDQIFGALGVLPPGFLNAAPFGTTFTRGEVQLNSYAAFAHGTYHVTDRLDLTVGARYTHEKKEVDYIQTSPLGNVLFGLENIPRQQNSDTWSSFTPAFIVDYKFNPDVHAYASITKGFKSGGFSDIVGSLPDQGFDPETTWNHEIGLKAVMLDNRMQLSAAAFILNWNDQQGTLRLPPRAGGVAVVDILQEANIGDIQTKGIEVEVAALPFEGLRLTGGLGILSSKYRSVTPEAAAQAGVTVGTKVAGVPDWTVNFGARYGFEVGDIGEAFFSVNGVYRDDQIIDSVIPGTDAVQEGYGLINAHAGFSHEDSGWSVNLWVKNIGDKDYITFQTGTSLDNFVYQSLRHRLGAPRTYGFDLRRSF